MKLYRHKTPIYNLADLFRLYFDQNGYQSNDRLLFLVDLVQFFRPNDPKKENIVSLKSLLDYLEANPAMTEQLKLYLAEVLLQRKFGRMLSDTGILRDSDFTYEVKKRLFAKILPFQPEKDTLEFVLNQVFFKSSDPIWIARIPFEELQKLFDIIGLETIYESVAEQSVLSEVMNAMGLISQRMSGRAMETDVIKMVPEYDDLESPFVAFENELNFILAKIRNGENHFIASEDLNYKQLMLLHKQCEDYVDKAFGNSSKFGISLKVNQSLLRIRQQLHRMKVLISTLVVNKPSDKKNNSILLLLRLIKYNCQKNNVRQLINESTQLISYEITQHTAKTGEHYITESRSEYFAMLKAAVGGGFIVGILCIIKLLFSKIETSGFGHAFYYSLNYSLGFIAIYLMGYTLATKQPAMTAATLIKALESGMKKHHNSENKHGSFAQLFARLFRSQFIAFVGNVFMAFPVSMLGIWLIDYFFDYNIAFEKSSKLLFDLSPIHSAALFHAAIAGVFLFLSGIISGNVSNRNKHNQVYYRIKEHPVLKQNLGIVRTNAIAKWFENHWPGVVSNGWFGVFLGSTASLGIFLGLNIDIRHITFASGNFALGLYGADFFVDWSTIVWAIIGIGLIGFVNFAVSFSLSLGLAFRSRNIPLSELRFLFSSTWVYFKSRPTAFFFPVKDK
ncbi:recombinase [Flavobacterium sp. IMCC34852]|uniref:Recombinase n=1 Tax=Flavobacterium rivulicola TaxID=2732161 RepID=A0A7Y3VY59_9FLAO|nr:recombinase [Flavobacterium sp. IMCC34852]NNT71222.1 recombinase [Flavobacterium sp. IMCC34852]